MDICSFFITTTRYGVNKLPNIICFHGHFQSTEKIEVGYQYLDEYKLHYLFSKKKKKRISKENALHMNIGETGAKSNWGKL